MTTGGTSRRFGQRNRLFEKPFETVSYFWYTGNRRVKTVPCPKRLRRNTSPL